MFTARERMFYYNQRQGFSGIQRLLYGLLRILHRTHRPGNTMV